MSDMKQVHDLAKELQDLRDNKKELEEKIKEYNEQIKDIEENTLAPLLDDLGVEKVSLDDMDVTRRTAFRGRCGKTTDPKDLQYLFDTNNDGALNKLVIVNLEAFPRTPFVLMENGIDCRIEYSIHPATLGSIIRELVEAGKLSPADIEKYHIYMQPQVSIKRK